MATVEQQAKKDMGKKKGFENELLKDVTVINHQMTRDFVKFFDQTGNVLNADDYFAEFERTLNDSSGEVSAYFSNSIGIQLPKNLQETDEESSVILNALLIYFFIRSAEQAKLITRTNQKDFNNAAAKTELFVNSEAAAGRVVTRREQATMSGVTLGHKLGGRAGTIASTEVQVSAEVSQITETEVLIGRTPTIVSGSTVEAPVIREWVTAGDEKVRPAHVAADGQKRFVGTPFDVGGQGMNYPGDTSLGASLSNTINCRCDAVIVINDVLVARTSYLSNSI